MDRIHKDFQFGIIYPHGRSFCNILRFSIRIHAKRPVDETNRPRGDLLVQRGVDVLGLSNTSLECSS